MKGLTKRLLSLVICAAVAVFTGCGNPWMKRITASLYDKPVTPGIPGVLPALPVLTGTVSITWTLLLEGETLSADTTLLDGSGTISYQWGQGDVLAGPFTNIAFATAPDYTLQTADNGKYIFVTVTRDGYDGSVSSDPGLGPVGLSPLTGAVTVTGTPTVGQTLTADPSSLGGSGTVSYQWRRSDVPAGPFADIASATASTYTLQTADNGKYIVVMVTRADNSGYVTSGVLGPVTLPVPQMTHTINGVSVPFRYVPAGSFQRDGWGVNVTITNGYWMGETEVTQELFEAVMGVNPSEFNGSTGKEPDGGETQNKRPVEYVNWYAAIAFCNKLSLLDGKEPVYSVSGISNWASLAYSDIPTTNNAAWNAAVMDMGKNGYRLPTEMEWMWAAMGADKTVQPNTTGYTKDFAGSTGSNSVDDYAWYDVNSNSKTHEVGKKAANELGLYDMSGNIQEWCWDWFDYSYPGGTQTDPPGVVGGAYRVLRGGAWNRTAPNVHSAYRGYITPFSRADTFGFRLVRP